MVRLRQVLGAMLLFFGLSTSAWCMPWVDVGTGTATWMRQSVWDTYNIVQNMGIDTASADGTGGIVLASRAQVGIDAVDIPFTMVEMSSAAEVAAAAAFLPEAAVYAVAGATIGELVWNASKQIYQVQSSTIPSTFGETCPDGSAALTNYFSEPTFEKLIADHYPSYSFSSVTESGGQYTIYGVSNSGGGITNLITVAFYCPNGGIPSVDPNMQDVPPELLPPYILPWLQSNPDSAPQLAQQEQKYGHPPDAGNGPQLSGPASTSFPPVTTTVTNPDGSKRSSTTTDTINWQYSGPNTSGSTTSVTKTSSTPAPTASDPTPAPVPGPTSSQASPAPAPSSAPQSPFVPPTVPIPPVQPVPPGVINLPIPTIDNTAGTCPAPIVLNLGLPGLETLTWDLTPWCTLATNLRPLVLTAAGLAAAFLLVR